MGKESIKEIDLHISMNVRYLTEHLARLFEKANKKHCAGCAERCCCQGCARAHGYLPGDASKRKYNGKPQLDPEKYKKWIKYLTKTYKFQPIATKGYDGFLTPTGCTLPRHLRSHTCLSFTCSKIGFNNKNIIVCDKEDDIVMGMSGSDLAFMLSDLIMERRYGILNRSL
jgi:hypothetical protein